MAWYKIVITAQQAASYHHGKIQDQFEAIFKEVSAQLKKVEKEKNDALAWRELDHKIKFYNALLLHFFIVKCNFWSKVQS